MTSTSSFAALQRTYQRAGWFALATSALLLVGVIILWGGRATTESPPAPVAVVPHAALDHWRAQEHALSAAAPEADAAALDRWLAQNPTVIAIENVGQFDPQARFVLRGVHGGQIWIAHDGSLWFDAARATDSGAWERQAARLRIGDPAGGVDIIGEGRLPTRVNYFIGNDPTQWRTEVPVYAQVRLRGLTAGADLVVDGRGLRWEGRAGASAAAAALAAEGATLVTRADGTLALALAGRELPLPLAAEGAPTDGGTKALARPLLQTPPPTLLLEYATYLGGSGDDRGNAIAHGGSGVVYLTGYTDSANFPTTTTALSTSLSSPGLSDAFVVKLDTNVSGTAGLLYATYLGGSGDDRGNAIAHGGGGVVYLTGQTNSINFPTTTNALSPTALGGGDAFVVKLDTTVTGTAGLSYSTYLGGILFDSGYAIAHGGGGVVYLTGETSSSDFPTTTTALSATGGTGVDAFVVKLDTTVSGTNALAYSTYLGGSNFDRGYAIAHGGGGVVYLTGQTGSTDFPTTTNALDTTYGGGGDAFVVKLDTNVSGTNGLAYSTYLGGDSFDSGHAIAYGGGGVVYLTGETQSNDFPTTSDAYSLIKKGTFTFDAFVVKLDTTVSGTAGLAYGTFLGGNGSDQGRGIALDGNRVYVAGYTSSTNFPTTSSAYDTTHNGGDDAFVVTFRFRSQLYLPLIAR